MDEIEKIVAEARARGYSDQEISATLAQKGIKWMPAPTATQQIGQTVADGAKVAAPLLAGAGAVAGAGYGVKRAAGAALDHYAEGQTAEAVKQSGGVDELMKRVQRFEATGRGKLITMSDLDPRMTAEADFVATNNPAARVKLTGINAERGAGAPQRLLGDAEQLAPGGYSSPAMMGDITAQSQRDFGRSEHGYQGLRDANPTIPPGGAGELHDFATSPELRAMWKDAISVHQITPMPKEAPTSFAVLQTMKEKLDGGVDMAFAAGNGGLGERLKVARDHLVDLLRTHIPRYEEVAAQWGIMGRRKELLQKGVEVWNDHSMQLPDLEREIKSLNPEELKAYRQGVLGGYISQIENAQTNRSLASQMLARSATTERKLKLIFGSEEAFKEAVTRYTQEAAMARLGGAVGGSQTARRGAASGAADALEGATDAAHILVHPVTGIPSVAMGRTKKLLSGSIARRMAPTFTEQGADALRAFLSALPK